MKKISKVKVLPGYRLELEFDDGVSGIVDLSENVGNGVFALWRARSPSIRFVSVHPAHWFGVIGLICAPMRSASK